MQVIYEPRLGNPAGEAMYQQALGNGGTLGVNVANGNLHVETPDVNYATEGYDTQLSRSYNSEYDNLTGSAFGYQWTVSMGEDTLLYPSWWDGSTYLQQSDGSFTRFDRAPWADGHPETGDRAYTSEAGVPATLVVHENGTRTLTYNNTGVEWQFDNSENGFPQTVTDPDGEGNKISLSYTSSRLTKVKDTHGHELTLTRSSSTGNITKIKDGSETWTYKYTSGSYLESYEGPAGQKAEYHYDAYGDLTAIIEPAGTIVVTYDGYGRVASLRKVVNGTVNTVGSEGEVTSFAYGAEKTVVTNPGGTETSYYYNALGDTTEEPATQEAASIYYAGATGIGSAAATADMTLQDRAAGLDSELAQQLGGDYVGEWFEPVSGHVEIGISSGAYEQTVIQDLDDAGLASVTTIVTEAASGSQLKSAASSLGAKLSGWVEAGLVSILVEPHADGVTAEEADSLTTSQKSEVSEGVDSLSVPTKVTEVPYSSAALSTTAAECGSGTCDPPLRGGVRIRHPQEHGETVCTAGFVVRSNHSNLPYLLTAGHCLSIGEGTGESWYADSYNQGTEKFIGKAHSFIWGEQREGGDAGNLGDMGLISIESSFWDAPLQNWIITYGNSELAEDGVVRNERYPIEGAHNGPDAADEQFVVCFSGVGGGSGGSQEADCGEALGYTYADSIAPNGETHVVYPLVRVNVCTGGKHATNMRAGASGSPVYKNYEAYGILADTSANPCEVVYQGIENAQKYLNVHLMTHPAK